MSASLEWSARTRRPEDRLSAHGIACVIEADDVTREHMASVLRAMGYVTHETGGGTIGAMIAEQVRLDVIVVNVLLPEENGLKIVRALRSRARNAIIIALTPYASTGLPVMLARFAGADAVLASPALDETLATTLSELSLERARANAKPRVNHPIPVRDLSLDPHP
ncbi:MAG TPA: response regulator [Verrucomicrobiae bacterium]|jgi:CheY-like chemotaxis protein|nr:response regulator [Verrucomicrobiae bacterium]